MSYTRWVAFVDSSVFLNSCLLVSRGQSYASYLSGNMNYALLLLSWVAVFVIYPSFTQPEKVDEMW